MQMVATTRMSSIGQVVIPEGIRRRMGLKEGAHFAVVGEGDVVILKTITAPSMDQFDRLIRQARRQAKTAGLELSDIKRVIAKVRSRK